MTTPAPNAQRVLVAGGGVAGLEAVLALKALASDRVDISMLAPEQHFTYRPLSVGEPFEASRTARYELAGIARDAGFTLTRDALASVDTDRRQVHTQDARVLDYDSLVLAVGARPRSAVPGALTFRGPQDVPALTDALERIRSQGHGTVAFVVRSGTSWTLPLYELALMTEAWGRRHGVALEVVVVSAEVRPLEVLGKDASLRVALLLASRGIQVHTEYFATQVEEGELVIPLIGSIPVDLAVSLPFFVGPAVPGLPRDRCGFVPVDEYCRVRGLEGVYAIGDMTDIETKQGGLATQQADVASAHIAASAGVEIEPKPFAPVLRALMFTGDRHLWLRSPGAPETPHRGPTYSVEAEWWPPHKIVGRHLGTYLALHSDLLEPVADPHPALAA